MSSASTTAPLTSDEERLLEEYPDVRYIPWKGRKIFLVGTAHVSQRSVAVVEHVINTVKPDVVAVELCAARHRSLTQEQQWQETDIVKVIREKKSMVLLANLLLASFQKRLGAGLGVRPGQEMLAAVEAADKSGARIVLADREIQLTLKRAWGQATFWDKCRLIPSLLSGLFSREQMSEDELERLRNKDILSEVMDEFARHYPRIKVALIDERDQYLAKKIDTGGGEVIVAVVGAGHCSGMEKLFYSGEVERVDLLKLEKLPPASPAVKIVAYGIPLFVICLIAYGFFSASAEVSFEMIKIWVLANGILAALFTALTLAHPLTILTAFVAAPITSLNPMIAAGWVAGLVEAWVRKPKVSDFLSLSDDITTLRGFWRNDITRLLLVVVFANIGSSLGTFIGIPLMARLLG